ncbi:MAG: hypothetical protein LBB08_00855, partial [Rickettsiales bacterium]|nr:hypothetical protein [Rickettsiales bacterium]
MKRMLLLLALSGLCGSALAETLPTILSEADVETYGRIFALQDKGKIAAAKKLDPEVEDDILMGEVQHQRYMSKNYAASGLEVAEWLDKYPSHPGAESMFRLSKKKRILARSPIPPSVASPKSDGGAYNESTTARRYYGSIGNQVGQIVRFIKRRNIAAAAKIMESDSFMAKIARVDYGRLAGRLAFTAYNSADFAAAAKWGKEAAERGSEFGFWTMGLLSYKNEDYASSQKYFEAMLVLDHINTNRKVEAAFWAGRAAEGADDSRAAKKHWKYAMNRPASFYGAMSASMLGREPR